MLDDPSAASVLGIAHEGRPPLEHARAVAARLHEPVLGILGTHAPLTADDPDRRVDAPALAVLAIVSLTTIGLAAAAWRRRGPATAVLFAAVLLTIAAFPFPVRSGPETLRFLTPALAPALALVAAGWVALAGERRAWAAAATLAMAQAAGGWALARAWRQSPEPLVPDCADARAVLEAASVRRAFASYNAAYCLTYESGETIVASQPWNERFYGHPLPYLDEVRFARDVAWVLEPGADFELPAPRTFEAKLAGIGSRQDRVAAGRAVVYLRFVPPFPAAVRPGAVAGPAGDGDVSTRILNPPVGPATFALTAPIPTAAITVVAGGAGALPASLDLEVSSDGATFARVGRRRRARATVDLAWANGHPELADDAIALTVQLDGREVRAVRLVPIDQEQPWPVAEVLVHPTGPAASPWPEWLPPDLSWRERRERLAARPRPDDVGWYLRLARATRP